MLRKSIGNTFKKQSYKQTRIRMWLRPYSDLMTIITPLLTLVILIAVIASQLLHLTFVHAKGNVREVSIAGTLSPLLSTSQDDGALDSQKHLLLSIGLLPHHGQMLENNARAIETDKQGYQQTRLSEAHFRELYSPDEKTYTAIDQFLQSARFSVLPRNSNRLIIGFSGSVGLVEQVFQISMRNYLAPDGHHYYANATPANLPEQLAPNILSINGLNTASSWGECQRGEAPATKREVQVLSESASVQGKSLFEIGGESIKTLCSGDSHTLLEQFPEQQTKAQTDRDSNYGQGRTFTLKPQPRVR